MKAHEFISRLDEARYGHRMAEDNNQVAEKPSHAPTSGKDHTTTGQGKSEDKGETVKKAYKQPSGSIPAPVATAPSHAPTSGKDPTTTGQGKSEDEGEKISKEAMKEAVARMLDSDGEINLEALLGEGGHKAGCQCGFCKNKGKMGKKDTDTAADETPDDDDIKENFDPVGLPPQAPQAPRRFAGPSSSREIMNRMPVKRRLGGNSAGGNAGGSRFGFRTPFRPPAPTQARTERLDTASNPGKALQEIADDLLEAPEQA